MPTSIETGKINPLHVADYVVFGVTLGLSALIGIFYAYKDRNKKSAEEYHLGGRDMHPILVTMSLLASFKSATAILGHAADVYTYNTMYIWIVGGLAVMCIGAAHIFIPIFYKLGFTSVFKYIEMRFDHVTKTFSILMYMLLMLFYMAVLLYAPSLALNAVTGLTLWGSICAIAVVCTFYTTLGGLKAVLWADTIQMVIVFAGLFALAGLGLQSVGGVREAFRIADERGRINFFDYDPDLTIRYNLWNTIIGGGVLWCGVFGTNQAQVQRALSVRSLRRSKIAIWMNLPPLALFHLLTVSLGVVLTAFYRNCDPVKSGLIEKKDQIIPLFMMDMMGDLPGLPGLFLSCIFSGTLSSISSGLNALSAITMEDFIKPCLSKKLSDKTDTLLCKVIVVVFGGISLVFAYLVSTFGAMILRLVISLFGIFGGPIFGVFVLGMLFPWANKWGARVGLFLSTGMLIWIGMGAIVTKTSVYVKSPISIAECPASLVPNVTSSLYTSPLTTTAFDNITTTAAAVVSNSNTVTGIKKLYTLSYSWYSLLAVLIVVVVGMLVSLVTGVTDTKTINPNLICPFFDTFFPYLPERWLKKLRFGVRHGEEVTDFDEKRSMPPADTSGESGENASKQDLGTFDNIAYSGNGTYTYKL